MTDNKPMETEPGGENTQYESIKTVTNEAKTDKGQFGKGMTSSTEERRRSSSVSEERGEKTAENIRYGQGVSESGFGGKTTVSEGIANQGGYGGAKAREEKLKKYKTRAGIRRGK